jgi:hypothetical protein
VGRVSRAPSRVATVRNRPEMKEGPSRSAIGADLNHHKLLLVDELHPCVQRRHHVEVPLCAADHAGTFISAA